MGGRESEVGAAACAGRETAGRAAEQSGRHGHRADLWRASRFRLTVVITAAIVGVGALGGSPADGMDLHQALQLQTPKERIEAPDFQLADFAGKKVRLRDYRGRMVFLNFFATWCGPCREEMPDLQRLSDVYRRKGLAMLAVSVGEGARAVRGFVRDLRISFPALLDEDGSVSYLYGIRPIPVSFLVDRDGAIVWRAMGAREWDSAEVRQYLDRMLESPRRK